MISLKRESAKARVRRMKKYASKIFGKKNEREMLVGPFAKPVNAAFLMDAISKLSVAPASERFFFYRNRPVNVEKFFRTLCAFDVAAHVSAAELPPPPLGEREASLGHVVILNPHGKAGLFLDSLLTTAAGKITFREFTLERDYEWCVKDLKKSMKKVIAFSNPLCVAFSREARAASFFVRYNVADLSVEEILGKLWREETLRVLGFGDAIIAMKDAPSGGKRYPADCAVAEELKRTLRRDELRAETRGAWAATVTAVPDASYPHGETAKMTIDFERVFDEGDLQALYDLDLLSLWSSLHVERFAEFFRVEREKKHVSRPSPSDIIRVMREKSTPSLSPLVRSGEREAVAHAPTSEVKRIPERRKRNVVGTRNAWVTRDKKEVSVVDNAVRIQMSKKKRKIGEKCPRCPPDAIDDRKTAELRCENPRCRAKFCHASTGSHFVWREQGKKIEKDMHLPLFDHKVMRALEKQESDFY